MIEDRTDETTLLLTCEPTDDPKAILQRLAEAREEFATIVLDL